LKKVSKQKVRGVAVRRTAAKPEASPWVTLSRNGSNLHIEDFLTFRITRLSNALRNNLTKRYLEEFGVSLPEWRLLALITRFSPLRFAELTSRSSMDKGQVSRTLQIMTKRGWIKMKAVTPRSSRSAEALAAPVVVSVTAKGKGFYQEVLPAAQRRQAEALSTLTKSERVALYSTLAKLYAFIGDTGQVSDEAI
jgi:DNA-binding MarR family transcriptional regulator